MFHRRIDDGKNNKGGVYIMVTKKHLIEQYQERSNYFKKILLNFLKRDLNFVKEQTNKVIKNYIKEMDDKIAGFEEINK